MLTFQVILHSGSVVLEFRLAACQFLVVLLQATTFCGHTAIFPLEAGHFSFQTCITAVTAKNIITQVPHLL